MSDSIIVRLKEVIKDPVISRRIYAVTLLTAVFILALALKGPEEKGWLITDSDGNVTAIKRHSTRNIERYDVGISIRSGGDVIERDVTLTLQAVRAEKKDDGSDDADSDERREAEIDAEIDSMIADIEYRKGETISLPREPSDGSPVSWHRIEKSGNAGILVTAIIYFGLLIMIIRSAASKPAEEEARIRREILKGLPRFCNQLYLMMNSGMILSDAFDRICESYSEYGDEGMTWLGRELTALAGTNRDHRKGTAELLNEFAIRNNVKEFIRITTILLENERRGSDVSASLSRESSYLWDDRKIVARECGKMIDTKMSYPLAALLILLIVITMAPAMLNM